MRLRVEPRGFSEVAVAVVSAVSTAMVAVLAVVTSPLWVVVAGAAAVLVLMVMTFRVTRGGGHD